MPDRDKKSAPLRRDTVALVGVLLETLESRPAFEQLRERLAHRALDLLEGITQALAGIDRDERLIDADAALQSLRTMLRLARDLDLLDDSELVAFLAQADRVGRQIGGWLHALRSAPTDYQSKRRSKRPAKEVAH